jgi:hypothetical protein
MTNNLRRRRRDWALEDPKAIPRFPSLHVDVTGTPYMFIQDIALGIVPFNARSSSGRFRADIRGASIETDRAFLLLSSLGGRQHQDVGEMLAASIEDVARNLAWFGRAPYEIVHPRDDNSICILRSFTPQRLFNLLWCWAQVVPRKDRVIWHKAVNLLARADVWVISMPKSLGGYRGYRAILRKLRRFDGFGPRFWRGDLERGIAMSPSFDFQAYRRQIEVFDARITRRWGWNHRDYSGRNWTEFMQFYRTLTFRWAQAVLREHIISELNSLLARLAIKASVSISGVPLSHEVLYLRNDMMVGNISYARAYEASAT